MSEAVADGPGASHAAFLDARTAAQQGAPSGAAASSAAAVSAPASPQPSSGRFVIKPRLAARASPPSQTHTLQRPPAITIDTSAARGVIASPSGSLATTPSAAAAAAAAASSAAAAAMAIAVPPSPSGIGIVRPASAGADEGDGDGDGGGFAGMSSVVIRPPTPPSGWNRNPSPPASRRISAPGDQDGDTMSLSGLSAPLFNPNLSLLSPTPKAVFQQGMSFDVSGSEFSAALRAALSEAGAPGSSTMRGKRGPRPGTRGSGGPSPATSMFDMSGLVSVGSGVMIAAVDSGSVAPDSAALSAAAQAAADEATERELRKQAIRQKNAMHMRIRNASVSQANAMHAGRPTRGGGGGGGGGGGAAPPNGGVTPRESKESHLAADSGLGSARGSGTGTGTGSVRRSATMHTTRSTDINADLGALSPPDASSPTHASKPSSLAAFLMGTNLPQPYSASVTAEQQSQQPAPPKRTLSSILKPTAHVIQLQTPAHSHRHSSPKRQQSGILRMPSLRSNRGSLTSPANADAAAAGASGLGLQRSATAGSRLALAPAGGDAGDHSSSLSGDDSDGEDNGGGDVQGGGDGTTDETSAVAATAGQGSVKSRKGGAIGFVDTPTVMEHMDDGDGGGGDGGGDGTSADPSDDEDWAADGMSTAGGGRRTKLFAQDGSRLMLQSMSALTASAGGHGRHAASVMVASVSSIFTRLRRYTDLCFLYAAIGVVLTVVTKELHYAFPLAAADGPDAAAYWTIVGVRVASTLSTLLLIYYLYKYHQADFQFLQLNRVYLLRSAFWNTQLVWSFALEVLCCAVHEPPFVHHDVDMAVRDAGTRILTDDGYAYTGPIIVRNPWSLLVVLRFYVFLRLILSRYYTGGTKILGLWFNFNFNLPFAIRNMLYSHPLLSLAPVVCMLICSCSYSLWVFEREVPGRHFSFGTATWVVLITITSVGYGDVTPLSSGGRAICILAAFIGILVSAVLVAAVHQKLTLLPYEGRMVEFLERDSNSTSLKYFAARCIARSWRYYHWRKRCVRLLARNQFNFVARANLLRHKTVMLQAVFDFQSARKQIQAYDRRYHSEQLFRSMLEGLYDKLESMTLDLHVLEDELDLSYEEQRRMAAKQTELLDEVRNARGIKATEAGQGGTNDVPAPVNTPEHGSLSLLRGASAPSTGTPMGSPCASPDFTRPGSSVEPRPQQPQLQPAPSIPSSIAREPSVDISMRQYKGGQKSVRNSGLSPDENRAGEASSQQQAAASTVSAQPLASVADTSVNSNRSDRSNASAHRSSTLGALDLVAAAAAVTAAHQQQQQQQQQPQQSQQPSQQQPQHLQAQSSTPARTSSALSHAPRSPSIRARSTNDLLGVTVEAPRSSDSFGNLGAYMQASGARPTGSLVLRTGNRRTTLTKQESLQAPPPLGNNVTSDLLAVVETIGTEMPATTTPAGRIRFGEADFAAHRAAPLRSGRGTITLQRGKTMDRGSMISNATMYGGGGGSIGGAGGIGVGAGSGGAGGAGAGVARSGSIELPGSSPQHGHAGDAGASGPGGDSLPLRPSMTRMSSTGGILRGLATSRASGAAGGSGGGAGGVSNDQFERMMQLLGNVSERLGGVEAQLDRERRGLSSMRRLAHANNGSPGHSSSHSMHLMAPSSHHAGGSQLPNQSPLLLSSQSHA